MTRQRALPARWVRGPERLTIIAGALLLMLSSALLILGWRYVAAANTNLKNAEQSAQTYVGRVSENVANLSQIIGFGTAAEALAPALAAPDASQGVADAMVERARRYVEACTCSPPRAQHVAVLSGKTGRLYEARGVANAAFPSYAATALRALVDTAPVNLRTVRAIPFTDAGYLLLARVYHSSTGTRVGAALTYSIEEFRELAAAHAFSRHMEAAYPGVPDRDSLFGVEFRWGSGELLGQRGWAGEGPSDITEIGVEPNVIYSIRATLNPAMAHLVVSGGLEEPPTGLFLLFGILLVLVAGTGLLTLHRARELMTARTLFLSGISHELRTPLTQVLMYGETLQDGDLDPRRQQRAAEVIVRETRRLIHMIENVLLFARGPGASIPLNLRDESLADVVASVLRDHGPVLARHDAHLEQSLDERATARVDLGALRQILGNLLDNALRYGPRGQCIRVSVMQAGDMVEIVVDDEGPGIALADRRRVLKAFERAGSAAEVEGTGIGLALVEQLTRAMGGRVRIEDAPGRGARIVVSFPCSTLQSHALAGAAQ